MDTLDSSSYDGTTSIMMQVFLDNGCNFNSLSFKLPLNGLVVNRNKGLKALLTTIFKGDTSDICVCCPRLLVPLFTV